MTARWRMQDLDEVARRLSKLIPRREPMINLGHRRVAIRRHLHLCTMTARSEMATIVHPRLIDQSIIQIVRTLKT
jgi:hypothetical protein